MRIDGEHKVYGRPADSGFEIRFHFCPNCGTSVFWEGDRNPQNIGIAVGCFADPDFPAPASSGWEESMHRWLGLPPGHRPFPAKPLVSEPDDECRARADPYDTGLDKNPANFVPLSPIGFLLRSAAVYPAAHLR